MTVTVAPRFQNFNGLGVVGGYTFNFYVLLQNDNVTPYITVTKIDALGNITTLNYPADYSFTAISLGQGGGIVMPLVAIPNDGSRLFVKGSTPLDQAVGYRNQGPEATQKFETSFDKLTLIAQEALAAAGTAITIPLSDTTGTNVILPSASLRANQALVFDSVGNVTVGSVTTTTVSAAMVPVVQASTLFTANKLLQNGNVNSIAPAVSDTNVLSQLTMSANSYIQTILQNTNSGAVASADIVVGNNSMTATTFFGNFGMNSSGFTGAGSFNIASAVYLSSTSGELVLGTTTSNGIHFVWNNSTTDAAVIDANGFRVPNPTGTSATQVANIGTAYAFASGFVNKFRNPAMQICQRTTGGTITAGSEAYTVDGWKIGAVGANAGWAQAAAMTGSLTGFCLQITGNTGMTDTYVKHRIESGVIVQTGSDNITFQCKVLNNSGASVTPTLTVNYPNSTDNYSGTTQLISAVALQACPNNATTTVAYTFANNANYAKGMEIFIEFGAALNTNVKVMTVSDFDIRATPGLAVGQASNPPHVELRPMPLELNFNYRYYFQEVPLFLAYFWYQNSTTVIWDWPYPVPMRTTPTFSASSGQTVGQFSNGGSASSTAATSSIGAGVRASILSQAGFTALSSGTSGFMTGGATQTWSVSAEL